MQEKGIFTIQWVIEEKDPHTPLLWICLWVCFVHVVKLNSSANLQFKRERRWVQTERRWVQTRGRSVGHRIFLECLNYNWIICIKSSLCRVMLLAYFIFFYTLLDAAAAFFQVLILSFALHLNSRCKKFNICACLSFLSAYFHSPAFMINICHHLVDEQWLVSFWSRKILHFISPVLYVLRSRLWSLK